jgi:hypothetical protein
MVVGVDNPRSSSDDCQTLFFPERAIEKWEKIFFYYIISQIVIGPKRIFHISVVVVVDGDDGDDDDDNVRR